MAVLLRSVLAADGPVYTYVPPTWKAAELPPFPELKWLPGETQGRFHYNTTFPDETNWIGIFYAFGGYPQNGTKVMDPVNWVYAPKSDGIAQINTTYMSPGSYRAYFMAKDGYETLAHPVEFSISPPGDVKFFTYNNWGRPAREGEYYTADVSQLASVAGDPMNNYRMVYSRGDGWLSITADGILYGTPTNKSDRISKIGLYVVTPNKLFNFLEMQIVVKAPDVPLVDSLTVMSMNMWCGGTNVDDYHEKQIGFITKANADIVGLQETSGVHAMRLAHALGWWAYQTPDSSIISRYPIVEVLNSTSKSAAVRIAIDGDKQQVVVWNAHLGYTKYGPYGFCFDKKDNAAVMQMEADSGRTAQAKELGAALKPYVDNSDKVPVILTGDFNAPSHLDWTSNSSSLHCGAGNVRWPSSWYVTETGMRDSFRELYPDPVAVPGNTWSPIYLTNGDYGNQAEPKDRIDFVYYAGAMKANQSTNWLTDGSRPQLTAEPKSEKNYWTSDHLPVITTFQLNVQRARQEPAASF